jgi:hypothetical protein
MNGDALRQLLTRQPFKRLRVKMTSGQSQRTAVSAMSDNQCDCRNTRQRGESDENADRPHHGGEKFLCELGITELFHPSHLT